MTNSQINAGSIHAIKVGKTKRVDAGGYFILVCNVAGQFYAVDDLCTHEDASLYLGCLKGDRIHCSLHGGEFCVKTGKAVEEPAEIDLKTYPITIQNDEIWITI